MQKFRGNLKSPFMIFFKRFSNASPKEEKTEEEPSASPSYFMKTLSSSKAIRFSDEFLIGKAQPTCVHIPDAFLNAIQKMYKQYPKGLLKNDVLVVQEAIQGERQRFEMRDIFDKNTNLDPEEARKLIIEDKENEKLPIQIVYGERESMAYLACRVSNTFAPIYRILTEISHRLPNYTPKSLFDFATGTAIWAANDIFGSSMKKIIGMDVSLAMLDIAESLNKGEEGVPIIPNVEFRRYLSYSKTPEKYDIVISNFGLLEFPDEESREEMILRLWEHTKDMLVSLEYLSSYLQVIVERGTPFGFEIVLKAREMILEKENGQRIVWDQEKSTYNTNNNLQGTNAHVFSPCPHDGRCPMENLSWCHFDAPVIVTPIQKRLLKFKDPKITQKYSYVVLRRGPRPSKSKTIEFQSVEEKSRIIHEHIASSLARVNADPNATITDQSETIEVPPEPNNDPEEDKKYQYFSNESFHWDRIARPSLKRGEHVIIDTCTANGDLKRVYVPKSQGRIIYSDARKSKTGDLWPHSPKHKKLNTKWESR